MASTRLLQWQSQSGGGTELDNLEINRVVNCIQIELSIKYSACREHRALLVDAVLLSIKWLGWFDYLAEI